MVLLSRKMIQESENNCDLGPVFSWSVEHFLPTHAHMPPQYTITPATSVSFVTLTPTMPLLCPWCPMKTEAVYAVVGSQLCFCQ